MIDWGEVFKYLGPSIQSAGATVGQAVQEAPEAAQRRKMNEITLQNELAKQKQLKEAEARKGLATAPLGKLQEYVQSVKVNEGKGDMFASPSLMDQIKYAQTVGLPALRDVPEVESVLSGLEKGIKTETDISQFEREMGLKEKSLGLQEKEIDARLKELDTKKELASLEMQTKMAETAKKNKMDTNKMEFDVQKEFNSDSRLKSFIQMEQASQGMTTIWNEYQSNPESKKSKGALDQALITLYNKLLDPSSVVREAEYARTPENMAYIQNLEGKVERFKSGGAGLKDEYRQELVDAASTLMKAAESRIGEVVKDYSENATSWGLDPQRVIGNYSKYLNVGTQKTTTQRDYGKEYGF